MFDPIQVINDHIPSLTDEDENDIADKISLDGYGYVVDDYADLAIRTCRCGTKIDGFYEYVDHLKSELTKAMTTYPKGDTL